MPTGNASTAGTVTDGVVPVTRQSGWAQAPTSHT